MLEGRSLAAMRGNLRLFSGIHFSLQPGDALVVTGANGSGKTTLLRIVAGLGHAAEGELAWRGDVLTPFHPLLRENSAFIGHAPALKDELTAEENLALLATLHHAAVPASAIRDALTAVGLLSRRNLPARVLSQGQRRRIGLARLLLVPRRLWVLDEPTTALDVAGIAMLEAWIGEHLAAGGILVTATHQELKLPAHALRTLTIQ